MDDFPWPRCYLGALNVKKQYLKSKPICKVTFELPKQAAGEARKVSLVGEFNDWSAKKTPMKKLKNGNFKVTLDLDRDHEYQFKYLIDGETWENDWEADRYAPNPYGDGENSVIVL